MPTFVPPVVYDNPPIYVAPDRYRSVPKAGQLLRRYYGGQPRGRSVLRIGGAYRTVDVPSQADIDAATEVYLGGHIHEVDQATADRLTAAGYVVT